jgi:hypothetical protein
LLQGSNKLAAEVGDIRYDPAPHLIALTKSGLIDPGCAGVYQVIFNAE